MTWLKQNALALLGAAAVGIAAYAAHASQHALLEEKVRDVELIKANVLILCTHLRAPCRDR